MIKYHLLNKENKNINKKSYVLLLFVILWFLYHVLDYVFLFNTYDFVKEEVFRVFLLALVLRLLKGWREDCFLF